MLIQSSLGDACISLGDAKSSLDAKSLLGEVQAAAKAAKAIKPKLPPVGAAVFDGDATATDAVKVFEHAPGCRVCRGQFKHYTLPDGRVIHMFKAPRTIIDQVQVRKREREREKEKRDGIVGT
jgi:hypothetical protein